MFCPNCGTKIPDDSVFCEKCGYKVEEEPAQEMSREEPEPVRETPRPEPVRETSRPEPPERGGSGAGRIVVIALALAVLGGAGFLFTRKGGDGGKETSAAVAAADTKPTKAAASEARPTKAASEEKPSQAAASEEKTTKAASAETKPAETKAAETAPAKTEAPETAAEAGLTAAAAETGPAASPAGSGAPASQTEAAPEVKQTETAPLSAGTDPDAELIGKIDKVSDAPAPASAPAASGTLTAAEMAGIAEKLSTSDNALALDFEWALDVVLNGGGSVGSVVTDPSQAVRITGDLQPLLNGGWKAFLFTEPGVYGSDQERYCNAEISTSGNDFSIRMNYQYLFDPASGTTIDEGGSADYYGEFDAQAGTAYALTDDSRIDFDEFYVSPGLDAEYALGTFTWISGEKDRIALMRKRPGAGGGKKLGAAQGGKKAGAAQRTASLEDFDWYYNDGFPTDGTPLNELQDLGGNWKCLLRVTTADPNRLMLSDAEIQYMGYKVTVLMHVRGLYEHPAGDRGSVRQVEGGGGVTSTYEGDWDDGPGYIEATSVNSALGIQLRDFVKAGGKEYAFGSVYNEGREIGEIAMVR